MNKIFSLAFNQIKKNKARASLTIFGITIGIMVVILVLSAGNGVKSLVLGELDSFGNDWIDIEVKIPSTGKASVSNAQDQARGVTITSLTTDDADAVGELNNIKNIYAGVTTQAVVSYGNEKKQPMFFAVTPSYIEIDAGSEMEDGQFFSEEENSAASQVIVLGSGLRDTLFGNDTAVGKKVKVGDTSFRVIGVMKERGATGFFNYDELAYIPVRTAQKKLMGIDHVLFMIAQMRDAGKGDATAEEIRALIRDRHDITDPDKDDFSVTTQQESVALIDTVFFGIQALLVILAAISLVVGGVGIMNVMYVSVVERTFEIGLRKSVGATEASVRAQFLIEAIVLTALGGVSGIVIGILLSYLIAVGAQSYGLNWEFVISLPSIFLGTGFSVIIGLVFGYFPAKHAASLDPITALRQE
ncbi:MAG: multidrug ABC transporter substrate-binding protein [Candidatus Magasanikbacteria bacterium CG_4_9_14_0_2_um_filter_42_11]|uniref:Multidrug ABC transporter substrate-binding protein n=1 Tax=Candidatus Magasanikbacteria bacterium CG_4_9_14_0_2_um_filter_42_11 TaxID=1974643 RepID=A0A2M8FAF3_9BACT|nr:MAG: multidrug ABC transporter substrate-binding protein [Candidatus Magasanikbacteria bacterium CG10_big_fil_rev_8_21_14_0_10_43_9]PIY92226.1 MAG: multidrug ABC transporter substrate-binding protein [Candidatus Magasanikbacteria bacterium CG_4_10_14_0_8_um_filter_42_12]PJC52696.1 MAG: multidrug ABC transporter substrate-binding protein [Candidatus Magasanikbacteria bacterium CG_4_9_14_0_2_um_filter_42_11]